MNKFLTPQKSRANRIRAKLLAITTRPRLTVNRSNSNIFAQVLDQSGKVIVALGSQGMKDFKGTKIEMAEVVGKKLGEMAKEKKVTTVVFDRGSYKFHGRIKALAEGVRESGIKF